MAQQPDLSVIVVTHQGCELALQTLRTARSAAGPLQVEWLVVDSGSTDGTPVAVEQEFPDIVVVRRPNIGFAAANNIALTAAGGRYVLLLNPDMEVVDGTLAALVAAMDERPAVAVGSVLQQWPEGGLQATMRRFPSPARQLGEALMLSRVPALRGLREEDPVAAHYETEHAADWIVGGFMLVRREAIDRVGGLDERFFLFSEETDWCRRMRSDGWEVRHFPLMRLVHHTGRSARPDLFAQNSYAKVLYARKHFTRPGRAVFRAALTLRHALRTALFAAAAVMRPRLRPRVVAERRALLVVAGVLPPPFSPYVERSAVDARRAEGAAVALR